MAEKNSDMENMWALMKESNAGVMKIVMDTNGVPASRMMIFVDGVTEVAAIKEVVEDLEDTWEIEREDNAGTPNGPN
jgi:hypothetical protein